MKKILSIVMCACVILSTLVFAGAIRDDGIKFTVASDTHLQALEGSVLPEMNEENAEYSEGMLNREEFYYAAQQGQMNYESTAIIKSMLADFAASDSDILLIAGDLTNGKRQSHLEMAQLLKNVEQSGKRVYVINGNHDCDEEKDDIYIDADEFKTIYADFGFNEALERDENSASYTADLSDKYRLIAIDSCIYGKDDGEITDAKLEWITAQAKKAESDGKQLVAMMHHSLLPHFYVQPMIKKYSKFADKFSELGINVVLTGHIHANDISSAVAKNGKTIYDIQTGSLITAPNAYREITLSASSADVKTKYVAKIDAADLPSGYSVQQLERISTDFTGYASDIFEAGVCRWLNRYIGSAGKVGKMLKLEKGSKGYALVDKIMKNIGNALNMPIYDDGSTPGKLDSIQEIARAGGSDIPQSDYIMPYQLAAKVMGSFYAGDEEKQLEAGELDILFLCIKSVLAQALTDLGFGDFNSLCESLLGVSAEKAMVSAKSRAFYSDKLAIKLAHALIISLTDGLTSDLSEPADLNVTLDLSIRAQNTVPLTFFEKLIYFFKLFISTLKAAF